MAGGHGRHRPRLLTGPRYNQELMKPGCCLYVSAIVTTCLLSAATPAVAQGTEHQHETPPITKSASQVAPITGDRPTLVATKTTERPRIDGVLDETAWSHAQVVDRFVQQEPQEGQPATDRTEVRVLFDEGRLYIGVHAFSTLAVTATEMRRDAD